MPAESRPTSRAGAAQALVIVTGLSGAGRTTVIHALEDLGYEAINNFPLSMVDALMDEGTARRPLALGVETRTRGFSAEALDRVMRRLRSLGDTRAILIFLDCTDEALVRRFSATRRRHPLAPAEDVATGLARERDLLAGARDAADMVIDTTNLTPHQLKREINARFAPENGAGLTVSVHSFSFKRGIPPGSDMVLDCRFLANPYWAAELRARDGRDPAVQDYVSRDPRFPGFFERVLDLLLFQLPASAAEGKVYFSVALGCTGGRHRSVTLAERLAGALREAGWPATLRHHELERGGAGTTDPA
ncbi:MAG: RNase adapter RapZ [Pseudomonadota bacterium]